MEVIGLEAACPRRARVSGVWRRPQIATHGGYCNSGATLHSFPAPCRGPRPLSVGLSPLRCRPTPATGHGSYDNVLAPVVVRAKIEAAFQQRPAPLR